MILRFQRNIAILPVIIQILNWIGKLLVKFSLSIPSAIRIHEPGFDGVDTKSQHNNSKSSCTSIVSPNGFKLPIPRDDTPTIIPLSIRAFNILPEGVGDEEEEDDDFPLDFDEIDPDDTEDYEEEFSYGDDEDLIYEAKEEEEEEEEEEEGEEEEVEVGDMSEEDLLHNLDRKSTRLNCSHRL